MKRSMGKNKRRIINITFILFCFFLLLFLYFAPEETTSPLPTDELHEKFHLIKSKKEADSQCVACHNNAGESPLPEEHPPPFRCLFCHKRNL